MRKILTYRWHVGHQYDLWKLPFHFTLMTGLTRLTGSWDYKSRPLPANTEFVQYSPKMDLSKYDAAILHFDEFVLRPELARGSVSDDWGNQFKFLMENFKGPKVAICHGVPVYKGACDPTYREADAGEIIDSYRQELVDYLGDTLVICNSYQAQQEWGFKNSRVIWHGFDPLMHAPSEGTGGIVTLCGQIKKRPIYRGYDLYQTVMDKIGWQADFVGDDLPNAVEIAFPPEHAFATKNEWGMANYLTYMQFLRRYGVFFNPTMRSPMPRVRGEAMMSGLAMVTTDSHDASRFIEHGYNGFVTNDVDELAAILKELLRDSDLRRTIGRRSRETALALFHVNRFLKDWEGVVSAVGIGPKSFGLAGSYPVSKAMLRRENPAKKLPGILYVSGSGGGTDRYRVQFAVEAAKDQGLDVSQIHIRDVAAAGIKSLLESGLYQAMVCHRVGMSDTLWQLIESAKANGVLPVYDVDDLVFVPEFANRLICQGHRTPEQAPREVESWRSAIKLFNHATCTTEFLKHKLVEIGVRNVELIPNTCSKKLRAMSEAAYLSRQKSKQPRNRVVIGYPSGSATHDRDLEVAAPALGRILAEHPNVELRLIGYVNLPDLLQRFKDRVTHLPFVDWLLLPSLLADFDICIAPLEDDDFCNAKSELKYVEAGFVRVPTVASATQPFRAAIQNEKTGFVAANGDEWYRYLKRLVTNAALRREIGEHAYQDVTSKYVPEVRVTRTLQILSRWLGRDLTPVSPLEEDRLSKV